VDNTVIFGSSVVVALVSVMAAMLSVTLQCGSTVAKITVPNKNTELRDLQQEICRAFRQRFPWQTATLLVGDRLYDEFGHTPFAAGPPEHVCVVTFEGTRDMYWVDHLFRDKKKKTSEEDRGEDRHSLPAIPDFPMRIESARVG